MTELDFINNSDPLNSFVHIHRIESEKHALRIALLNAKIGNSEDRGDPETTMRGMYADMIGYDQEK